MYASLFALRREKRCKLAVAGRTILFSLMPNSQLQAIFSEVGEDFLDLLRQLRTSEDLQDVANTSLQKEVIFSVLDRMLNKSMDTRHLPADFSSLYGAPPHVT